MDNAELAYFKKLLLQRRSELSDEIEYLKKEEMEFSLKDEDGDNASFSNHLGDHGTDMSTQEQNFLQIQRDSRLLYHIDEALKRIDNGTYGQCEGCGRNISKLRLEALPHARLCIRCKLKEEKNKRPLLDQDVIS